MQFDAGPISIKFFREVVMRFKFAKWAGLLLSLQLAALVHGQESVATSKQQVPASPIDTNNFFIRIDESYNYQPVRPENPINRIDAPSVPNSLKAGSLMSAIRGSKGPLFPAVDATGWTPPDPDLAVGPNHVVAVVNSSVAFFTKAGVKQFQQTAGTFFTGMGAGSFIFDPKAFYDRAHGRYVIVFLEQDDPSQTSKLLFAVSDDNDPNGTWFRYRIESKLVINNIGYWLDYPGFGYNSEAYVVSGNMFGFSTGFAGVQFITIPTAQATIGATVTATSLRDSSGASAQVAEMVTDVPGKVYALSRNGSTVLRLYSINNPGGSPSVSFTSVTVPSSSSPTGDAASTSGRFLDTLDGRVFNVTWRDGRLVAAHNFQNGSFAGSRWYEVATNNYPGAAPTLIQSGNIGSASQNYFMPAISVNSQGSISAIFTGSSTSITANLNFAGRQSSDPAGSMGAPTLLESSAGTNYSQGRWGDYFGVDVDPSDDVTFWGIGMTVASTNNWRTSIFSWTIAPPAPASLASISVSPTSVVGGNSATGTATLTSAAPAGGIVVALSSNSAAATVPASVTVPAGSTSATFAVSTTAVASTEVATISGSYNGDTRTANLTITAPASASLSALTLNPTSVAGGSTSTGTVTLTGPAPAGGLVVALSDNSAYATVPATVTVAEGSTSATFTITTTRPPRNQTATITASHNGVVRTASLTIRKR